MENCCEVPIVEKLRSVQIDYRTCVAIQWAEDGSETGHRFIPVGHMMHEAADEIERLRAALYRISKCEDAPEIDATGEWQFGLYCGVEDRFCRDRYDGADFGHVVGVEKALEWAMSEAKAALEQAPNPL